MLKQLKLLNVNKEILFIYIKKGIGGWKLLFLLNIFIN